MVKRKRALLTRADAPSWARVRKELLVPAFKHLRKHDILARHQHLDVFQSSAAHTLSLESDEYVGYTTQSVPNRPCEPWEGMYLFHCLEDSSKAFVRSTFVDAGLVVDWDGTDEHTIYISLPHPRGHWWAVLRRAWRTQTIFDFWLKCTDHLHMPGGARHVPLEEVMAGEPALPPPGVTAAFEAVSFTRHARYSAPWHNHWWLPADPPHPWNADDEWRECWLNLTEDEKEQECWRTMGNDVASIELSDPEVYDEEKDTLRPLKGGELDAIAFVGDALKLRSYETMGEMRNGKDFTKVTELEAPRHSGGRRYFTIAELHRALEKPILWHTRCAQFAKQYSPDHCFFEGLHYHKAHDAYTIHWGS